MDRRIVAFGSIAATAFCIFVASDAKAAGPYINPSVTSSNITFVGDGFTPGGDVWVGLSVNGTQQCIWNTTGTAWGFVDVTEQFAGSECGCGNTYQAWALDWSSRQGSNVTIVSPQCIR